MFMDGHSRMLTGEAPRSWEGVLAAIDPPKIMRQVNWAVLVQPHTQIHVLHGGTQDPVGVTQVTHHLAALWEAGVVYAHKPEHLHAIVSTMVAHGGTLTRLTDKTGFGIAMGTTTTTAQATLPAASAVTVIVQTTASVVAAEPAAFDTLVAMPHVRTIVAMPVQALCGAPFDRRACIVAVLLPSARVAVLDAHDAVRDAIAVYGVVDRDTGAGRDSQLVDKMVAVLPHGSALAWSVRRPQQLRTAQLATVGRLTPARAQAQSVVDRTWCWNSAGWPNMMMPPGELPALPTRIAAVVHTNDAPFSPARDPCLIRQDAHTLAFVTTRTQQELTRLRLSPEYASRCFSCHVVSAHDGSVLPYSLSLAACVDVLLPPPANDGHDDDDDDDEQQPATSTVQLCMTCLPASAAT